MSNTFKNYKFQPSVFRDRNQRPDTKIDTAEDIDIKSVYLPESVEKMDHLSYVSGIAPFLRGPYSSMYAVRPWTIRQYAGFSTAEASNAFYKRNLAQGQKGLSVAVDLADRTFTLMNKVTI